MMHSKSEYLENLKTDASHGLAAARIPDFQDFRFSPTPAATEILPGGLGWGRVGDCPERRVYAKPDI
jgi:hypothetical protein